MSRDEVVPGRLGRHHPAGSPGEAVAVRAIGGQDA